VSCTPVSVTTVEVPAKRRGGLAIADTVGLAIADTVDVHGGAQRIEGRLRELVDLI
jgi:hypothetical protein